MLTKVIKSPVDPIEARITEKGFGNQRLVLLVHGGPTLSANYLIPTRDYLVEQTDHSFDVGIIDLPNHGSSWTGAEISSFDDLATRFSSFLSSLDSNYESIILIGHSLGAVLSAIAATHEESISAVIAVSYPTTLLPKESFLERDKVISRKYLDPTSESDYSRYLYELTDEYFLEKPNHETKQLISQNIRLKGNSNAMKAFGNPLHYLETLSQVRDQLKIFFIHGSSDPLFAPLNSELFKHPNSRFLLLDNSGHYPMLEQPELFNLKLSSLLKILMN